jgi:twitching motility protein PilT
MPCMAQTSSRQLGELLIDRKVLSRDVLELVLDREEREGIPMSSLLVKEGLVHEKDIIAAVAEQVGLLFVDLAVHPVRPDLDAFLDPEVARLHHAIVVDQVQDKYVVAMENPSDPAAVAAIETSIGLAITCAIAVRGELAEQLDRMYGPMPGSIETLGSMHINVLLERVLDLGGSDLHLTVGVAPAIRVNGSIKQLTEFDPMNASDIRRMLYDVLTQKQRERFEEALELDTSHTIPGHGRFRMNVFQQRNSMGAVFRAIPTEIVPLENLGLPPIVHTFAELHRGLVLVTGPTGSGKSTTLASVVDIVNSTRDDHIMTVEDPIEFVHAHKRCVVNQREVGEDTLSFGTALKHVLRQDPDVILVGEMRDLDTISTAITAAETGHLVFGTVHTQDAPQAIDRIIDVFPAHQQQQVRVQLASSLMAVCTQQLIPTVDGLGRAVASEVMIVTPAIRNLIREAKTHQIYSSLQSGGQYDMQTMDQSLAHLVREGSISMEVALERCRTESDLTRTVSGG